MKVKKLTFEQPLPKPVKIGKLSIIALIMEIDMPIFPLPKPKYTGKKRSYAGGLR